MREYWPLAVWFVGALAGFAAAYYIAAAELKLNVQRDALLPCIIIACGWPGALALLILALPFVVIASAVDHFVKWSDHA